MSCDIAHAPEAAAAAVVRSRADRAFKTLTRRAPAILEELGVGRPDPDALADLLTDAALEAARTYEALSAEQTWAETVLRLRLQDARGRRRLRRPAQEPEWDVEGASPREAVAGRAEPAPLWELLPAGEFDAKERLFLAAVYEDGYTQAEAAGLVGWGTSRNASSERMSGLLGRLKAALVANGTAYVTGGR